MSEVENLRNVIDRLRELYTNCFNVYVVILLIGIAVVGILGIWVLLENCKDKYFR